MMKTILKSFVGIVAGVSLAGTAFAAGGGTKPAKKDWGFNGLFGTYDKQAMQRGYQVYKEVCASCHALEHLSFYHLALPGGPYYMKEYPDPNDNPYIKALAREWSVQEVDRDTGDLEERPGIPADKFPPPFANEFAARASNAGALPPDLSVITKARGHGSDYLYALMTGYKDTPAGFKMDPGMYYNEYFDGNQIAMAPPLAEDIVEYATGIKIDDGHGHVKELTTPAATVSQMSKDVTEFLTWAGDPKMETRKKTGLGVMLFLLIFAVLTFLSYRAVWRDVEH